MELSVPNQFKKIFKLIITNHTKAGDLSLQEREYGRVESRTEQAEPFVASEIPQDEQTLAVHAEGGVRYTSDGFPIYTDTQGAVSYRFPDNKSVLSFQWDTSKSPMLEISSDTDDFVSTGKSSDGSVYYVTILRNDKKHYVETDVPLHHFPDTICINLFT